MSELRRDPISGRWVIIAPERFVSPSLAAHPRAAPVGATGGDMCPFCEGQEGIAGRELLAWRPHGVAPNGPGWQVRVVASRVPALRVEQDLGQGADTLFPSHGGLGAHEVIIESPDHGATLANMSDEAISRVLWAWRERMRDLRRDLRLKAFMIVKNFGEAAGATLDHPHSQLLALPIVPQHLDDELAGAIAHHARTGRCGFCDMMAGELANDRRVVAHDERTIAFAPFASRVPFEVWVMWREHRAAFDQMDDAGLASVAGRLGDVMRRLHAALVSPAFTLVLHTAPVGAETSPSYHWHLEILPRLAPMSGVALAGGVSINPVAPEDAAEALRDAVPYAGAAMPAGVVG